jgi:hypothetical protein
LIRLGWPRIAVSVYPKPNRRYDEMAPLTKWGLPEAFCEGSWFTEMFQGEQALFWKAGGCDQLFDTKPAPAGPASSGVLRRSPLGAGGGTVHVLRQHTKTGGSQELGETDHLTIVISKSKLITDDDVF